MTEYQSDPDAIKNLLEQQKVAANSKLPKEEDQYLSFSEASEDYEYYFCRVKKDKGGGLQKNDKGLVNAEVLQKGYTAGHTLQKYKRDNKHDNKNKYEGPLKLN